MKDRHPNLEPSTITNCVVFTNPKSTRASVAKRYIKELRVALPSAVISEIITSPNGHDANKKLVEDNAKLLGLNSLICIVGGDGTTSQIIEGLITSDLLQKDQKATPVLPLWGGNANDLAHMLNGTLIKRSIQSLLKQAHIVPIHPLKCSLKDQDGSKITRLAVCYAGFGATAFAAMSLNKPAHRHSKLHALPGGRAIQNIITVAGAFIGAPKFAVKEADDIHIVYERIFSNGSRMAKLKYLPVELTDEMFYLNTLEHKKITSAIPKLLDSTRRRVSAKFLRNFAYFTTQENVWGQFDGEPLEIAAHTKVQVELSPQAFRAVTTNLGKEKSSSPR